ncbi:MAG: GGDEF domain-containing protein [Phycisphaerae bacterium]|nr:GGDEF domain-containing protein [Phycisphaerae bacterium]
MNPEVLDKVLSCQKLPSLPAVAVKVIELTQDRNSSIKELAATIRNDQGLSAKILKTVNSSFYALRKPCSTIDQAIVMLGLSAVKTLALGFSLVSTIAGEKEGNFDYDGYWRRSLFTGVAAKCIASESGSGSAEECFLGGLLQDVGMIALHQAMPAEYAPVLAQAGEDHRQLAKHEFAEFEVSHADIGALLAHRWKLPDELVMPIKYHERPSAAPPSCVKIVQAVALGNIAAEVMSSPEPAGPLKRFYEKAEQWFNLTTDKSDDILRAIGAGTKQIANLLSVKTGHINDADEILGRANTQLLSMSVPISEQEQSAAGSPDATDPLTALPGRIGFNRNLVSAFERARAGGPPITLVLIDIDALGAFNLQHGQEAGDAALKRASSVLAETARGHGGLCARYDAGRLAMLLVGLDRLAGARAAEETRKRVLAQDVPSRSGEPLRFTASAGVVTVDVGSIGKFADADAMVTTAERALDAAKAAGRNTIKVYAPKAA